MELPDIKQRIYEALEKERTVYPVYANRASEIGHPCLKYLVMLRTRWEELPLPSVQRLMVFRHGKIYEAVARDYLTQAGFQIVEQERPYYWKAYNISGKIDFKLTLSHKKVIPVEVKGLNQYDFDSIDSIEDFLQNKKHWIRKYPAQLTMYMLMDGTSELGLFFIVNKVSFDFKPIWIHLDYTFGEELIRKAEAINKHVEKGTVPEGVDDIEICSKCDFLHICLPEIKGKDLEVIVDEEMEEILKRCEELKEIASEYERLSKLWKKKIEGKEKLLVGDFLIVGKQVERNAYTVEAGTYWRYKVMSVSEKGGGNTKEQNQHGCGGLAKERE